MVTKTLNGHAATSVLPGYHLPTDVFFLFKKHVRTSSITPRYVLQLPATSDSGTTCVSPCPFLHHNFGTSFRPTNQCHTVFSAHIPPSTTIFSITLLCFAVHHALVFLRNIAWIGSSHTLHSCSTAHVFQYTILACFNIISLTYADRPLSYPPPCPSTSKVWPLCGH